MGPVFRIGGFPGLGPVVGRVSDSFQLIYLTVHLAHERLHLESYLGRHDEAIVVQDWHHPQTHWHGSDNFAWASAPIYHLGRSLAGR